MNRMLCCLLGGMSLRMLQHMNSQHEHERLQTPR